MEREKTERPQTRSVVKQTTDKGKAVLETSKENIKRNEKKEKPKEGKAREKKGRKQNNQNAREGDTRSGSCRNRHTATKNNSEQSKKKQKTVMDNNGAKQKGIADGKENESTVQFSCNTEV